jgi:hypothetical protein
MYMVCIYYGQAPLSFTIPKGTTTSNLPMYAKRGEVGHVATIDFDALGDQKGI